MSPTTASAGSDRRRVIDVLQQRIRATLDPLIAPGRRFALVEYPTHHNVGDQAIWLGESRYLAARSCAALYMTDRFHFSAGALRRRLRPGDLILLHGGGNLGDVHPAPQALRERILHGFAANPVVQLPQTVHFRTTEAIERARTAIAAHPDFTLLVRDRASRQIAEDALGCSALLCPDMAFMLGPLKRPAPPSTDVLWLARTDRESAGDLAEASGGAPLADWQRLRPRLPHAAAYAAARWAAGGLGACLATQARPPATLARWSCHGLDPAAQRHLRAGSALLGSARVVVTDRLHAHILCLLLGIPHVVIDNNYGKLSSYLEAWTGDSDLVHAAADREQAARLARSLLDAEPAPAP